MSVWLRDVRNCDRGSVGWGVALVNKGVVWDGGGVWGNTVGSALLVAPSLTDCNPVTVFRLPADTSFTVALLRPVSRWRGA